MKKLFRVFALLLLAAALAVCAACAHTQPDPAPPEPEPADGNYAGMSILDAYAAAKGGDYIALAQGVDTGKYTGVIYRVYGEALEEYTASGADMVARLHDALAGMVLGEAYDGDEVRTDSGAYVGFTDKSGEAIGYTFDMGYVSLGGTLYNVTGEKALRDVTAAIMGD